MGDERREDSMVANFVLFRFLLKVWFTKSSENYQAQNLGKLYAISDLKPCPILEV